MTTLSARFGVSKPILAMLHLKGDDPHDVLTRAMRETEILLTNGVDALVVENYFGSRADVETVIATLAAQALPVPFGINVLDDGPASFALADTYGAAFVQMDSVAGHLPAEKDSGFAASVAGLRARSSALLLGGVRFKYQPVLSGNPVDVDLQLASQRCDAVVVTGDRTGEETSPLKIAQFRYVLGPQFPLVVGAGVTAENCHEQLLHTDAAIVGSSLKDTGEASGEISPTAVAEFMDAVRHVRALVAAPTVTVEECS